MEAEFPSYYFTGHYFIYAKGNNKYKTYAVLPHLPLQSHQHIIQVIHECNNKSQRMALKHQSLSINSNT